MLGKQAKVLRPQQVTTMMTYLGSTRSPVRNKAIFLLSLRAGLRAKEIAALTWTMVTDSDGNIGTSIRLIDSAAKAGSGGIIPMANDLRTALQSLAATRAGTQLRGHVILTERRGPTTSQVIVNLFGQWYRALGFEGCSSHSGRRTFITNAARNIGRFGGSLRDVQVLARHSSLAMTQLYIDVDTGAMASVVNVQ